MCAFNSKNPYVMIQVHDKNRRARVWWLRYRDMLLHCPIPPIFSEFSSLRQLLLVRDFIVVIITQPHFCTCLSFYHALNRQFAQDQHPRSGAISAKSAPFWFLCENHRILLLITAKSMQWVNYVPVSAVWELYLPMNKFTIFKRSSSSSLSAVQCSTIPTSYSPSVLRLPQQFNRGHNGVNNK